MRRLGGRRFQPCSWHILGRFDETLCDSPELNAEFLWRQQQFTTWPALERSLGEPLDQAIQRESPDCPKLGRAEMRHRRALKRFTSAASWCSTLQIRTAAYFPGRPWVFP